MLIAAVTDTTRLQFPALGMVEDGYDVYGVIDASGAESPMADGRWPMAWEAVVATLAMHGVKVRTLAFPLQ